jgi:hypothetical protein
VEWSASTASTMARLGGVTQQGLGDACGVFDSHKKGVFF